LAFVISVEMVFELPLGDIIYVKWLGLGGTLVFVPLFVSDDSQGPIRGRSSWSITIWWGL